MTVKMILLTAGVAVAGLVGVAVSRHESVASAADKQASVSSMQVGGFSGDELRKVAAVIMDGSVKESEQERAADAMIPKIAFARTDDYPDLLAVACATVVPLPGPESTLMFAKARLNIAITRKMAEFGEKHKNDVVFADVSRCSSSIELIKEADKKKLLYRYGGGR